jgi:hypothetical protein
VSAHRNRSPQLFSTAIVCPNDYVGSATIESVDALLSARPTIPSGPTIHTPLNQRRFDANLPDFVPLIALMGFGAANTGANICKRVRPKSRNLDRSNQ